MAKLSDLERLRDIRGRRRTLETLLKHRAEEPETLQAELSALEDQRREIIRTLETLPQLKRDVLLLHYDGGLTWEQISEALNMSVRNAYYIKEAVIDK